MRSIFFAVKVIVPHMQKQRSGGSFIQVASTAGIRPRPGLTWYSASKAAVINASKTMAVEYAKDIIRLLSVCPVLPMGMGLSISPLKQKRISANSRQDRINLGQTRERKSICGNGPIGQIVKATGRCQQLCFSANR